MAVTDHDISNTFLSPRFCIADLHGLQQPKYSVIDDLTRAQFKSTANTSDTYFPRDLDALAAQVRALSHVGVGDLEAWSVDFRNAYKTIASHEASNDAATVCFINPEDNKPYKARTLVQPFGRRREPANWGRVATFIQFLACEPHIARSCRVC